MLRDVGHRRELRQRVVVVSGQGGNVADKPIARMWWCLANNRPWDEAVARPAYNNQQEPAAA